MTDSKIKIPKVFNSNQNGRVVELADTRRSERRVRKDVRVQLSPWPHLQNFFT